MRFTFELYKSSVDNALLLVATQSLEVLAGILNERNVNTVKVVVQCFATVYPLLFRQLYVIFTRFNRGDELTCMTHALA